MSLITILLLCVIISFTHSASNSCIDLNLSHGLSFSESVTLCQSSRDTNGYITSTLKPLSSSKTFVRQTKGVPPPVLNPAVPNATTTTSARVQPYLPYLLACSSIFSVVTITSKLPSLLIFCLFVYGDLLICYLIFY